MTSSSAFIVPKDFSSEWRDISLIQKRVRTHVYVGTRYARRFVLKAIAPEYADLTDYRLQQEQEFQLGIQLVHPNIAATYSLENIEGVGRCIVQEWIDGVTLGEWLQTKPSESAQERVFVQLLDALEYLHSFQLVHHDLKTDNILITRNGSNVKLIDFGLSALDATISPVSNDPQVDIQSLKKLFPTFVPKGHFSNIAALRHAIQRRKRIKQTLPVILSVLLLIITSVLFYLSWHEHNVSQAEQTLLLQELEATKQVINNGIDVDEIRAVIDSIYQPVYDSLRLPDARYQDVARTYIFSLPKPQKEYERRVSRFPVGSVQHSAYSEAWTQIWNNKIQEMTNQVKNLPYCSMEYTAGHISYEEFRRLQRVQLRIHEESNRQDDN